MKLTRLAAAPGTPTQGAAAWARGREPGPPPRSLCAVFDGPVSEPGGHDVRRRAHEHHGDGMARLRQQAASSARWQACGVSRRVLRLWIDGGSYGLPRLELVGVQQTPAHRDRAIMVFWMLLLARGQPVTEYLRSAARRGLLSIRERSFLTRLRLPAADAAVARCAEGAVRTWRYRGRHYASAQLGRVEHVIADR